MSTPASRLIAMQSTAANEQNRIPAWRSPWVIAWITLVIVVLGVNGLMVYFAFTTSPGLVIEDYYERGQNYERTMLSKNARDPGWVLHADIPEDIGVGERTRIRFFVVDRVGQPIAPDTVELFLYRPSDATRDFNVPMTVEGAGRYMADVSFPLVGVWDTLVAVRNGDDEYHVGQRIRVGQP